MTRSRNTDVSSGSFETQSETVASSRLANAAAASLAVVSLSLCLVVALTALSIKVMAATAIAG
jgi:hypothetical protein